MSTGRVLNRTVKQDSETTYRITVEIGMDPGSAPGTEVIWIQAIPFGTHSSVESIAGSDDGVSWTTVIPDLSTGTEPSTDDLWEITDPAHQGFRYWSLFYSHVHPGGFLGALSQRVFRLLDVDGNDYLGTEGKVESFGPPIPWNYVVPQVMVGPSVPYVATATGSSMARLVGCYHNVDFSGTAGPVTGDYTFEPPATAPHFGFSSGVPPSGLKTARWVWDLGE